MQRRTLKAILDDVSYSCGASFEDIEFFDGLESVCIRDHNNYYCDDPVERLHYSAEYDAICYCCASENVSSEAPTDVYPLCSNCIKNMLRREVNNTFKYMAKPKSCILFIAMCTNLMNNDLPPASYFENLKTGKQSMPGLK